MFFWHPSFNIMSLLLDFALLGIVGITWQYLILLSRLSTSSLKPFILNDILNLSISYMKCSTLQPHTIPVKGAMKCKLKLYLIMDSKAVNPLCSWRNRFYLFYLLSDSIFSIFSISGFVPFINSNDSTMNLEAVMPGGLWPMCCALSEKLCCALSEKPMCCALSEKPTCCALSEKDLLPINIRVTCFQQILAHILGSK